MIVTVPGPFILFSNNSSLECNQNPPVLAVRLVLGLQLSMGHDMRRLFQPHNN